MIGSVDKSRLLLRRIVVILQWTPVWEVHFMFYALSVDAIYSFAKRRQKAKKKGLENFGFSHNFDNDVH